MNTSGVVLGVGASALGVASLSLGVVASFFVAFTITSLRGMRWAKENSSNSPKMSCLVTVVSIIGIAGSSIPAVLATLGSSVAGGLAVCTIVTITTSGRVGVISGIVTFLLESTVIASAGYVIDYYAFRVSTTYSTRL